MIHRRSFLGSAALAAVATLGGCSHPFRHPAKSGPGLFFTSAGRTWRIHTDGSGLEPLAVDAPEQVTWQPTGFLPGGQVLLLSMEARRDGPGRSFEDFYHLTPTHVWSYDLERKSLVELATRDRMAVFYAPQLVLQDGRILMQVIRTRPGQTFNMKLDGSDAREFTGPDEGLPYGLSLSPDGRRVAFHLAGPQGYQIWTCDTFGGNRTLVAAQPDQLYFGPTWSPDGQWLAYQGCTFASDPGHDWADVCVARADGSSHRTLTRDQAMWFGATYGSSERPGGGSNIPAWTRDGHILFPRRIPDSKVPWEYQAQRPDTDHFNRDFKPALARGGTCIARIHPVTGKVTDLTAPTPGVWDFRAMESPDGTQIAFCRARTGESPSLWIMQSDGSDPRLLAQGHDGHGADHPRWIPTN